jgi:regulator of replication initiation timing
MSKVQLAVLVHARDKSASTIVDLTKHIGALSTQLATAERQVRDLAHRNEILARENARLKSAPIAVLTMKETPNA